MIRAPTKASLREIPAVLIMARKSLCAVSECDSSSQWTGWRYIRGAAGALPDRRTGSNGRDSMTNIGLAAFSVTPIMGFMRIWIWKNRSDCLSSSQSDRFDMLPLLIKCAESHLLEIDVLED